MSFIIKLKKSLANIPGWRTNRKILVFESDDWGSIRMPSKEVYRKCIKAGYRVDHNPYERYDSLLSQDDLELLFDVLSGYSDSNGSCPIITANCVVANPDFEKIKSDNFEKYYFELISDTFNRYPKHYDNLNIWKKGIQEKIFYPQFHGREHLNVSLFMKALKSHDPDAHFGFNNNMPGCIPHGNEIRPNRFVESTMYDSVSDKFEKLSIYLDGLDIFKNIFGYRSFTIIPTNYVWSPDFNPAVEKKGVRVFQGIRISTEPLPGGKNKQHNIYLGKRNKAGQTYLVRNAVFEPSLFNLNIYDPVNRCLSDIEIAFKMCKPVIITSHRINYAGFIDSSNRDRNLKMFNQLIKSVLKKWPEVEFMTSEELGRLILGTMAIS